jgi:hypothetical protein
MFDPKFIEMIIDYKNFVKKFYNEILQIRSMRKTTNVYNKDTMRLEKDNCHMYYELHKEFFDYYTNFFHSFKC